MFIIFGWNHQETISYGLVEEHLCQNCHNTEMWQLIKMSKYFTFFFIPIFSYSSYYWVHCPICNYGIAIAEENFKNYKLIAEVNTAFFENRITEEERVFKLEELYKKMETKNEEKKANLVIESKDWVKLASEKSTNELLDIINEHRDEYNTSFIIAAEQEIEKRNSKT